MKLTAFCFLSVLIFGCSSDDKTTPGGAPDGGGEEEETYFGVCEQCDLPNQMAAIEDGDVEDCGTAALGDDVGPARTCAQTAFAAKRPFQVVIEIQGTDSSVAEGWVYDGTTLTAFTYDSNICGGAPVCGTEGCGPQVFKTNCDGPTNASTGTAVFSCAARPNRIKTCGPCVTQGTASKNCQPIPD